VQEIDKNKDIIQASAKDFQQTCLVLLRKEEMLSSVVREIQSHQQQYKN